MPEAHVEASTTGSVLLASLLLKIGTFGLFRFTSFISLEIISRYATMIFLICIISIIYSSVVALRQVDIKKVIAYSSISHMGFVVIGLFCYNSIFAVLGSFFLMFSHALVSTSLFICVGILYERYGTKNIIYYSGVGSVMPLFSIFFFFFSLANISFPGTNNFVGEFFCLLGLVKNNIFLSIFAFIGILLVSIYTMWVFNRVTFGKTAACLRRSYDITRREFYVLFSLLILIFLFGLKPNFFFSNIELYFKDLLMSLEKVF